MRAAIALSLMMGPAFAQGTARADMAAQIHALSLNSDRGTEGLAPGDLPAFSRRRSLSVEGCKVHYRSVPVWMDDDLPAHEAIFNMVGMVLLTNPIVPGEHFMAADGQAVIVFEFPADPDNVQRTRQLRSDSRDLYLADLVNGPIFERQAIDLLFVMTGQDDDGIVRLLSGLLMDYRDQFCLPGS